MRASLLLSASALVVLSACKDPSQDVPAATVEAVEEAPAAEEAAPEAEAADPAAENANSEAVAAQALAGRTPVAFTNEHGTVGFIGSKVTGSHDGSFTAFNGQLHFNAANPTSSTVEVTIDMSSTVSDDPDLTEHLKSPDFFDVEAHPTAIFTSLTIIAEAGEGTTHVVSGNLTLHGETKTISFPANVTITDSMFTLASEFSIQRSDFNIVYPGRPNDLIREGVVIKLNLNIPLTA
jgi:polyisoprenoid-binding protein YceI